MNVCGIVCEYNPFHNGHLYHISQVRKFADAVVCVMSGNYVQRGEPAIIRKHLRAKAAILGGADLVIELPTPWAAASAERFAGGAIHLMSMLSGVSHLSFGCENNDIDLLSRIVEILESDVFSEKLKSKLKTGISFAAARAETVSEIDPNCSGILDSPNNILGIEYLKALKYTGTGLVALPILRRFTEHDSHEISDEFASASAIRTLLKEQNECFDQFVPNFGTYSEEFQKGFAPAEIKHADRAILAVLKRMKADDFLQYPDVGEGLHARIKNAVSTSVTFMEAVDKIKSKRYAHARIRRILLRCFLGITNDAYRQNAPYLRVLALNDTGRSVLSNEPKLPVIVKPASANDLTGFAKEIFDLECRATELYSLFMPHPATEMNEWNISPIYIPGTHK